MPITFQGGTSMPVAGTQAYKQAQSGSGAGTYNAKTGTISQGVIAPATANPTKAVGANGTTPTGDSLAPKSTLPVSTSQMAKDDYNKKYSAYQDSLKNIQAQTDRIAQEKAIQDSLKVQEDLNKSATNLQQQGLDIKKAEVEAKNNALKIASGDTSTTGTTSTAPVDTTAPTGNTQPINGTPQPISTTSTETSAYKDSINTIQDARTQAIDQYKTQVSQIMNGTFPLSTEETALINSVQQSLERQKASVIGVESMANARGGQEYTPQQMVGNLANKVMNLDAIAAGTMANLKMGFMKQDYQMINDAYEKQTKYLEEKTQTIQKLHDAVLAEEKVKRDEAQKITDSINKIAQEASKNGATPEQIAKITASKSESEAINNAGSTLQTGTGTLGDYLQYKRDAINAGHNPIDFQSYKLAEENRKEQSAIRLAELKKVVSGAGGVSPELQKAIDNGTIDPNRINSRTIGLYNDIAKAGIDAVGAHAGSVGETKAIETLTAYKSTAQRTSGVLEANMPLLSQLADKVNQSGIPGLDAYVAGKKVYFGGDENTIKYINSLATIRSEYAQMLAKGATATESDKAEAAKAIPAGLSSSGYKALESQLKKETANIINASDVAISQARDKSGSNKGQAIIARDKAFENAINDYGDKHPEVRATITKMHDEGHTMEEINNWINQ